MYKIKYLKTNPKLFKFFTNIFQFSFNLKITLYILLIYEIKIIYKKIQIPVYYKKKCINI